MLAFLEFISTHSTPEQQSIVHTNYTLSSQPSASNYLLTSFIYETIKGEQKAIILTLRTCHIKCHRYQRQLILRKNVSDHTGKVLLRQTFLPNHPNHKLPVWTYQTELFENLINVINE